MRPSFCAACLSQCSWSLLGLKLTAMGLESLTTLSDVDGALLLLLWAADASSVLSAYCFRLVWSMSGYGFGRA